MAKNFKREGETIDFTAAAATAAGTLVIVGTVACVSLKDVASGAKGVGHCAGVWELPALSAATGAQGAIAYATPAGAVTGASSGNTQIGVFWEAKVDGQTVAQVKLNA